MRPGQLASFLKKAWKNKLRVLVKGAPGIGKTDIIKQAAESSGFDLWESHPAVSEAPDFKGYPIPSKRGDTDICQFVPDEHLQKLIRADKPTVALFDDIGQSHKSVQAAIMQLIYSPSGSGQLNGLRVSPHVVFAGATNDVRSNCGVDGFIEPLKGRWHSIITLETSVQDFCEWCHRTQQPAELIAVIRAMPNLLHDFKPSTGLNRTPDPRGWGFAGEWLKLAKAEPSVFTDDILKETLTGCVGEGAAIQVCALLALADKAPSLDEILANPKTSPVPDRADLSYLVITGLSRRAEPKVMSAIFAYLNRLSAPLRYSCLIDVVRTNPKAVEGCKEMQDWLRNEGKKIYSN